MLDRFESLVCPCQIGHGKTPKSSESPILLAEDGVPIGQALKGLNPALPLFRKRLVERMAAPGKGRIHHPVLDRPRVHRSELPRGKFRVLAPQTEGHLEPDILQGASYPLASLGPGLVGQDSREPDLARQTEHPGQCDLRLGGELAPFIDEEVVARDASFRRQLGPRERSLLCEDRQQAAEQPVGCPRPAAPG